MKAIKVKQMLDDKLIKANQIIDIRESYETKKGKVKGSTNVPMNKLLSAPQKYLNKETTYYIICQSGARSLSTTLILKFKGYKVKNISQGYLKWKEINEKNS